MHRALLPLALLATPALADDGPRTWRGNEVPNYTVERGLAPGLEIRSYPSTIMAAVKMEREAGQRGDASFQRLAGYIFGGNSDNLRIAMTSPVISKPARMMQYVSAEEIAAEGTHGEWTRAFVLPSEYEMSDLPTPRRREHPRFRGRPLPRRSCRLSRCGNVLPVRGGAQHPCRDSGGRGHCLCAGSRIREL